MEGTNTATTTGGFSSPRPESFPAGLRVLVVDDDPTWLKILEKMLKKCSYEVTTCGLAIEALDLLRERRDSFDIVVSDVNMPDMDGFKLLEHVGLEMDLPVIMMSVDGETSRVMRGVQHGACDYLLKPIRMKELRNIWQHVYRKKIHEVRDMDSHDGFEEIQMMSNRSDQSDEGYFLYGGDMTSGKKRKDTDQHKHDESKDFADPSSVKRARVIWTVELHQKFVKAVNHIGFDKVGPKKILDLMNVPWLTRENVASHLQKYRLYLSRLPKDCDLKSCSDGIKPSDYSPKDSAGGLHNSINLQQNDAANCNYGIPSSILVQNARIHEGDQTGFVSLPAKPKKVLTGYNPEANKANSSRAAISHTFGSVQPNVRYTIFDSTFPAKYSQSREASELQFQQEQKPIYQVDNGFNHLKYHNQVNLQPIPSISHRPLNKETDKPANIEVKPSYIIKRRGNGMDSFSVQSQGLVSNLEPPQPTAGSTWTLKSQGLQQFSLNDLEAPHVNMNLGKLPAFASSDNHLQTALFQGHILSTNLGSQNKMFDCNDPEVIPEVPPYLFDALRFDYEYPSDLVEYPVIGQGLSII